MIPLQWRRDTGDTVHSLTAVTDRWESLMTHTTHRHAHMDTDTDTHRESHFI